MVPGTKGGNGAGGAPVGLGWVRGEVAQGRGGRDGCPGWQNEAQSRGCVGPGPCLRVGAARGAGALQVPGPAAAGRGRAGAAGACPGSADSGTDLSGPAGLGVGCGARPPRVASPRAGGASAWGTEHLARCGAMHGWRWFWRCRRGGCEIGVLRTCCFGVFVSPPCSLSPSTEVLLAPSTVGQRLGCNLLGSVAGSDARGGRGGLSTAAGPLCLRFQAEFHLRWQFQCRELDPALHRTHSIHVCLLSG